MKTEQLSIRLAPVIRERLEAAAERDRRPVSNLVRNVLADWLAERAPGRAREVA
jgi:predicted DNA-binding protein